MCRNFIIPPFESDCDKLRFDEKIDIDLAFIEMVNQVKENKKILKLIKKQYSIDSIWEAGKAYFNRGGELIDIKYPVNIEDIFRWKIIYFDKTDMRKTEAGRWYNPKHIMVFK